MNRMPSCDTGDLIQMKAGFGMGFMQRADSITRQFKLPAGFQTDIRPAPLHADDMVALAHGRPSIAAFKPLKQRGDRTIPGIGNGQFCIGQPAELFMFGPDAPLILGFAARCHIVSKLGEVFNRPAAGLWDRHGRKAPLSKLLQVTGRDGLVKGCSRSQIIQNGDRCHVEKSSRRHRTAFFVAMRAMLWPKRSACARSVA
jgi:hypothetical protein